MRIFWLAFFALFLISCSGSEDAVTSDEFCTIDSDCLFLGSNYYCDIAKNICKKKGGSGTTDADSKSSGDSDGVSGDSKPSGDTDGIDADNLSNDSDSCVSGQTKSCYSGPEYTAGKGICKAGTQKCTQQGGWGSCEGEVTPQPDNCDDTLDNDCSGVANDGFKNSVAGCICIPFKSECDGNLSKVCMMDGKTLKIYECDPVQGSTCVDGLCTGPCAPQMLENASYIGCDYFPTVTVNSQLGSASGGDTTGIDFAVVVSNSAAVEAQITITQGATNIKTAVIAANSVQVITLPWTSLRTATSTIVGPEKAYRLRTNQPVTLYQFNPLQYTNGGGLFSYTNDASLLLPTSAWANKYVVASRNTWQWSGYTLPGFYAVVARSDATVVTITPSATTGSIIAGAGLPASGAGTVTLNTGDILQVLSGPSTASDLTGTIVSSDKPVQIISGHDCTFIPADTGYCDHLEESMFPIVTLGNEYLVSAPSITNPSTKKAAFLRIITAEDGNTNITYDPPNAGWPASISGIGRFVELDSQSPFKITADKKILVSQYMKGQDAGGGTGDPAMSLSVPVIQYRNNYLFHAPTNYEINFVDVIAPSTGTVTLDGVAVSGFVAIGSTGFSAATMQLGEGNAGNHTITGTVGFFISVYGYGQYTSYWYPGGLNLTRER